MSDHSVFVIDDDSAVRDALLRVLRGRGVRARGFSSGTEFFAALPEDASACVITDVQMPGMDGTEIVRRLAELRQEHRELDAAIERLGLDPTADHLQLRRLKKRKLALKDRMTSIERIIEPGDFA